LVDLGEAENMNIEYKEISKKMSNWNFNILNENEDHYVDFIKSIYK